MDSGPRLLNMGCQGADAGVWESVEVSVRGWEGKYEEADSIRAGKTANIQLLPQEGPVAAEAKKHIWDDAFRNYKQAKSTPEKPLPF